MAKVEVFAGICGFNATIEAKNDSDKIKVTITSECKWINKLANDLQKVDSSEIFKTICDSITYQTASKHVRHLACPVPCAIIKAIEVEAGLALPKNVVMKIEK